MTRDFIGCQTIIFLEPARLPLMCVARHRRTDTTQPELAWRKEDRCPVRAELRKMHPKGSSDEFLTRLVCVGRGRRAFR